MELKGLCCKLGRPCGAGGCGRCLSRPCHHAAFVLLVRARESKIPSATFSMNEVDRPVNYDIAGAWRTGYAPRGASLLWTEPRLGEDGGSGRCAAARGAGTELPVPGGERP